MTEKQIERFAEIVDSFDTYTDDLLKILEKNAYVQDAIECALDKESDYD